jgi:hypothetical protein
MILCDNHQHHRRLSQMHETRHQHRRQPQLHNPLKWLASILKKLKQHY